MLSPLESAAVDEMRPSQRALHHRVAIWRWLTERGADQFLRPSPQRLLAGDGRDVFVEVSTIGLGESFVRRGDSKAIGLV